jgi:hypothetical protein
MTLDYQIGDPRVPLQPVWLIRFTLGRNCYVRQTYFSDRRVAVIRSWFALTVWRIL